MKRLSLLIAIVLALSAPLHAGMFLGGAGTSGEQGPTGPEGPEGPQGPPGSDGAQGEQGVPGYPANGVTSGCGVIYRTGLTYDVPACIVQIAGETCTAPADSVTLATADGSNPRIDLIVAQVVSPGVCEIDVVTGTPSATPVSPEIDSSSQVQIGFATIAAAASAPTGITTEVVYDENNDWTFAASDGSNVGNSSSNPHAGTLDIEGTTVASNDNFSLTDSAPFSLAAFNTLSCWIRPKADWGAGQLDFQWYNGASTRVGSVVSLRASGTFEFDSTVASYQLVTIPLYAFGASASNVDRIRATKKGSGTIGYYIDDCVLQGGVQQTIVGSASLINRGAWTSTANYTTNDLVSHGGLTYVAVSSSTAVTPGTDATKWTPQVTAIDATSAGMTLTDASKIWLPFASCQNTTAGLLWDSPTSNAPAAACITGTNTQKGVADFDAATDESLQMTLRLPADFTGAIDSDLVWLAAATSGAAGWCVQLVCTADAETDDPAFPAQGAGNCVSDTAKGTTLQTNVAADTGVTATGCAAGELLHIAVSRDANGGAVTDDMTGDARGIGVELTLRRAQ